jgi:hypothetical protein
MRHDSRPRKYHPKDKCKKWNNEDGFISESSVHRDDKEVKKEHKTIKKQLTYTDELHSILEYDSAYQKRKEES